jgi:hypothetical protein
LADAERASIPMAGRKETHRFKGGGTCQNTSHKAMFQVAKNIEEI